MHHPEHSSVTDIAYIPRSEEYPYLEKAFTLSRMVSLWGREKDHNWS